MPYDMTDSYEQAVELEGEIYRSYTMNLPVHACIASLQIGLKLGAKIGPARAYRALDPVVFYGSSIVHGTAAGRPGNIYPLMYMQKKIYMRSDGVMYGHFRTDGIQIQPSEQLENISLDELLRDADMSAATAYIDALQDTGANIERWQTVFTALK